LLHHMFRRPIADKEISGRESRRELQDSATRQQCQHEAPAPVVRSRASDIGTAGRETAEIWQDLTRDGV
jgi:hypothetical protein